MRRAAPDCRTVAELATAWLDGGLDRRLRRAVTRHLSGCASCREFLAQIRATVTALRQLRRSPPQAVPDEERALLSAAFRGG